MIANTKGTCLMCCANFTKPWMENICFQGWFTRQNVPSIYQLQVFAYPKLCNNFKFNFWWKTIMEDTARLTLFESLGISYAFLTVTHFVMQVRWVFGSVICWTLLAVHTRYPGFSLLPAGAETSPWVLMAFSKRNELLSSNLAYLACYLTCNNITCCFIICKDVKEIKVLAFSPTNMLNTFLRK